MHENIDEQRLDTVECLHASALVYEREHKTHTAGEMFELAMTVLRDVESESDRRTMAQILLRSDYAPLVLRKGLPWRAEQLLYDAAVIAERAYGRLDATTIGVVLGQAEVRLAQGKYFEAERYFLDVFDRLDAARAPMAALRKRALSGAARLLDKLGRDSEARSLAAQAAAISA